MYGFTAGIFVLSKYKETIEQFLNEEEFLIKFNDTWLGKLSTVDSSRDYDDYTESTLNLSEYIPLLHIVSLEGSCFMIRILHERKVKLHFDIPFELEKMMFSIVGFQLYGDGYMKYAIEKIIDGIKNAEIDEKINKEVKRRMRQPDFSKRVFGEFDKDTLKEFKLFGFSEEICKKLSNILTIRNLQKKSYKCEQLIIEFLEQLGLDNLNFVEHSYVLKEKFSFDVIAHGGKYTKRF